MPSPQPDKETNLSALAKVATHKQAVMNINGHKMAALVFNHAKNTVPIVFIHGITSSPHFWIAGQTPYVRDNLKWYALALPGHFPAAFPPGFTHDDFSVEAVTDVTIAAIRRLTGGQPVILVGHSTGGFMALSVAMRVPELVRGVVSISGFVQGTWTGALAPLQNYARMGTLGKWLFNLNLRAIVLNRDIYRYALRFYTADAAAFYQSPTLEDTIDYILPQSRQLDLDAMHIWFNRAPDIDISAGLDTMSVPTLVMAGDADPIVPPAQAHLIHGRALHTERVMYAGCGHLPMGEREQQYHADVTAWLQKMLD